MNFKIDIDHASIQDKIRQAATEKVMHRVYQVECPYCHMAISVVPGECYCPYCRSKVELTMNINFK